MAEQSTVLLYDQCIATSTRHNRIDHCVMKLIWFEIEGYKRFFQKSKVNVDGKLVAIVGPNEAGKTSLLRCLHHLQTDDAFNAVGGSQELSRGKQVADDAIIAEWTFALEETDYERLAEIPNAESVRWYAIQKQANGKYIHQLTPVPDRPLADRLKAVGDLRTVVEAEQRASEQTDEQEDAVDGPLPTEELVQALNTDETTLPKLTRECLRAVGDAFAKDSDATRSELGGRLLELHEAESLPPPSARILDHLWKEKPPILFFDQADRDLKSEYDIKKYFFENLKSRPPTRKQPIPIALRNLCSCSRLELDQLYEAQLNDDRGKVRTLLEEAEESMNSLLTEAWTQSTLRLSLELDQYRLQILLKSEKGDYVKVVERSEGLRQFLALILFLSKRAGQTIKPIVLIDEAEVHLHYDAQADLVQTLARQDLAAKVIYTTHSAGCLPEDLGSGVRMVATDEPHSTIENWFWNTDRPGFSPLLFAMGQGNRTFKQAGNR